MNGPSYTRAGLKTPPSVGTVTSEHVTAPSPELDDPAFVIFLATSHRGRMSPDEQRLFDYHRAKQDHPNTTLEIEDQITKYRTRRAA